MDFREAADLYVSLGWQIFPLLPGEKKPWPGSSGVKEATDDPKQIDAWAARDNTSNIAIACGASGIMVIDLDPRHGCWETLARWENEGKRLPKTVHARTRSGGLHLLFACADGLPDGWRRKLAGGIDIQVGNKYIVAPPSVIAAEKIEDGQGGVYTWELPPVGCHLPDPPRWLLDLLKPPPVPKFVGRTDPITGPVEARFEGAIRKVREAPGGDRNNTLNRMAHLIGRMIGEDGVDHAEAEARLTEAGLSIGLTPQEVRATVRSGLKGGMRHAGKPHLTKA